MNVLLALLVPRHVHHRAAASWFNSLATAEAGICRIVQLSVIRLLGNSAVMGGDTISAAKAWDVILQLLEDERVAFISESPELDTILPDFFRYPFATGKLVGDAYLAAFAVSAGRSIVTMDRGFRQFRGLDVNLLG